MHTTSATKTGTIEFMPSKDEYIPGTGVRMSRALKTITYTVEATLKEAPKSDHKKGSGRLDVTIRTGERSCSFTLLWDSQKLPGDRQCKKWVEENLTRLIDDNHPTKTKVK